MGFYKNFSGIEKYNSKDIEDAYIPVGKPFLFTYTERCIGGKEISTILVPCIAGDGENCGQCFFNLITEVRQCPFCTCDERKDGNDVIFSVLQKL